VLIETAFLSNLADRTLLTTSARQADFAVAIAAAIGALN
jgi:N-acetylmuramoyl-L-alanine amidase